AAPHMSAVGGKADIHRKPHNVCRAVDDYFCPSAGSGVYMLRPLSSLIVVVTVVPMMPIVAARVITVCAGTTVVVRSPPAATIGIADQPYLLDVRSALCRDWCDRHCSRCGRC